MDVEIRTTGGSWVTRVDMREIERKPGAAAAQVSQRIQRGQPVEVRPLEAEVSASPLGRPPAACAVFNPGNVVAILETPRGGRLR